MMKGAIMFLILVIVPGCHDKEKDPAPVAVNYLNEIMDLMEKYSINRKNIDWPAFRSQALDLMNGAQSIQEAYPAIDFALKGLKDHHSSYFGKTGNLFAFDQTCSASSNDETPVATIGYVKIRGFNGSGADADKFASDIQAAIKNQDNANIIGWVVDLRGNTGGNMWPMLAGIGPILGDGIAGYFIDPDGNEETWEYRNGQGIDGGQLVLSSVPVPYQLSIQNPKVAVLIDAVTASSGEAIAISFIGRPNTRSFGTSTCGVSTANISFTLSDGAKLVLTDAVMADRNKNQKGGPIVPDVVNSNVSTVYSQAVDWIRQP